MQRFSFVLFLMVTTFPTLAQCVPDAGRRSAAAVQQDLASMLKVKVEEMSPAVPPALRIQIYHFKNDLANAVDAAMRCANTREDAAELQSRLAKLLDANKPEKPFVSFDGSSEGPWDGVYGNDLKVVVSVPPNKSNVLAIEVSYGIACGDDTMLFLYEDGRSGWRQVMLWQSGEYEDISKALGDFFTYTILPEDGDSTLKVVVANGTNWCTSRFSQFKMHLLSVHASETRPRVLWQFRRSYSRGDYVPHLRSTADGFELRINAAAADIENYERTVIYRFRVDGDQITRIAPIAINGRGFVEEWLEMPWDEAKTQTAPKALSVMKKLKNNLTLLDQKTETYVRYSYGPVRACLEKGRYEVQMHAEPGGPQFFGIQEGQNGYTMVSFGTAPDERCSGPDLTQKRR